MTALKFDVHARTGSALAGYTIGVFLVTISARDHRTAKLDADELFTEPVVVLPHRAPTEKLTRALHALERRRGRTKPDVRRNASGFKGAAR